MGYVPPPAPRFKPGSYELNPAYQWASEEERREFFAQTEGVIPYASESRTRRRPPRERPEPILGDLIQVGFSFRLPAWLTALFHPAKRKNEEKPKRESVNIVGDIPYAHLILADDGEFTEAHYASVLNWEPPAPPVKLKPPDPTCRTGMK